ncbi:hypothetical protein H5410_037150 [Solanum commersonii]|uniref:Uncharacterized protein n=1 Tax=Solanum commersonii TaxID=4109 RepID=A0A9J5YAC7_SOLCO|nr:hypothetical protein H5410_037150 [Solanum commersonii]
MQGHNKDECKNNINNEDTENKEIEERRVQNQQPQIPTIPFNHMMQKRKARVLSSGIVLGDLGEWKIIKDGRYKPPITQTPHSLNNSFVVLADESTMSAINSLNNNKASPMANTSNNNKYNEVQSGKVANQQHNDSSKEWVSRIFDIIEGLICLENDMAIVEIPELVQTLMVYSPNMILPNIISHNIGEEGCSIIDQNQIAIGVVETKESKELWDIPLKADISPKLLKSAKNGKKDSNGENVQPTRIQPRRNK